MRKLDPKDERVIQLDQMLSSPGWTGAAKPRLEQELAKARRQLESVTATDVARVAGLQDRIRWLRRLIEDPRKMLIPTKEEEIET